MDDIVVGKVISEQEMKPVNTRQMNVFKVNTKTQVATFKGNQMIVTPSENTLSALDRYLYLDLIERRGLLITKRNVVNKRFSTLGEDNPHTKGLRERLHVVILIP